MVRERRSMSNQQRFNSSSSMSRNYAMSMFVYRNQNWSMRLGKYLFNSWILHVELSKFRNGASISLHSLQPPSVYFPFPSSSSLLLGMLTKAGTTTLFKFLKACCSLASISPHFSFSNLPSPFSSSHHTNLKEAASRNFSLLTSQGQLHHTKLHTQNPTIPALLTHQNGFKS